ncbi:Uncharacterized protein PBTT_05846 [Plasmodiophora brassicae]
MSAFGSCRLSSTLCLLIALAVCLESVTGAKGDSNGKKRKQTIQRLRAELKQSNDRIRELEAGAKHQSKAEEDAVDLKRQMRDARERIQSLESIRRNDTATIDGLKLDVATKERRNLDLVRTIANARQELQGARDEIVRMTDLNRDTQQKLNDSQRSWASATRGATMGLIAGLGISKLAPMLAPVPKKGEHPKETSSMMKAAGLATAAGLVVGGGIGAAAMHRIAKTKQNDHMDVPADDGTAKPSPQATTRSVANVLPWVLLVLVLGAGVAIVIAMRMKARTDAAKLASSATPDIVAATQRPSVIEY